MGNVSLPEEDLSPIPLSRAPIAEAVIDFRVLPADVWNPQQLKEGIIKTLPSYAKIEEGREIVYSLSLDGTQPKEQRLGCTGYKLTSKDENHVAQFNQHGFVCSRVKDYQDWDCFCNEARSLWTTYGELLSPKGIKRIGVRFINQMGAKQAPLYLKDFFRIPPEETQVDNWGLVQFMRRDVLAVPGTQYFVILIKTVLPPTAVYQGGIVVLDIDVFTEQSVSCSWDEISKHLLAIRDIKNKAFFRNIVRSKIQEYI